MKSRTFFALVAVVVIASSALAQDGRGGGGQRGFGGGMQFGGGMNSEAVLLQRTDVQKDLKLTDDQKTKLDGVRTEMSEKIQAQMQGMFGRGGGNRGGGGNSGGGSTGGNSGQAGTRGGGGNFDMEAIRAQQEEMRKQMEVIQKEWNDKAKAVLTEQQWTRLGQIKVQLGGSRMFLDEEFAKKLGLKALQKRDIQELMDKQQSANQQIFAKFREEGTDRDALTAELRKNDVILREEIEKLLTDEQKQTLADLEGPKFEADPNIQSGFGGGFGGRGDRSGGGSTGGGRGGGTTGGGGGF